MPLLDAIPVNWFIIGITILSAVVLYLILTQVEDDEEGAREPDSQKASKKKG